LYNAALVFFTNVALYAFIPDKQFLAEASGDSDDDFDGANEGDESDEDDGMLCECPSSAKFPLSLSLTS